MQATKASAKDAAAPAIASAASEYSAGCRNATKPLMTMFPRAKLLFKRRNPRLIPMPRLSRQNKSATPSAEPSKPAAPLTAAAAAAVVEDSIRVNVGTLETLMNLAGELVLGRNQLRASIAQKNARALKAADQRINQITSELQDVVMQTRLQPIGNVFGKFPRLVRDLAASLHKDIQLDLRGKDVALDRSLIESLSDPLTHMVRNAVDHGIESPEDRVKAGKSARAQSASMPGTKPARWWWRLSTTARASTRSASPRWP